MSGRSIDERKPTSPSVGNGGFRFAANLKWLFSELPIEARIAAAVQHGFRAIEYPNPYEYSIDAFGRMLANEGVDLSLVNTPPWIEPGRAVTGIACDPSLRSEFRSGVELGLEYAVGLGAPLLHLVGGPVPPGVSAERAWAEYLLNISWAVDAAQSASVTLVIEPQNRKSSPGFVLTTQAQAAMVIDAVGSSQLRLLFDVFHVQLQEGAVTDNLVRFAPIIGHIQIADAPDRTEPGTGELSWSHFFSQLKRINYDGWIGCEYSATTPQGSHVDWLNSLGET